MAKKTREKATKPEGPKDPISFPIYRDAAEYADHIKAKTGMPKVRYLSELVYADKLARGE